MQLTFGKSSKGHATAIYGNHEYWRHRVNQNGTIAWKCVKTVQFNCKGTLITKDQNAIGGNYQMHNHDGNVAVAFGRKAVAEMKQKVENIGTSTSMATSSVCTGLNDDILMALPKRLTIARSLQRHRVKVARKNKIDLPANPVDDKFIMPATYLDMVLHDSIDDGQRFIIFGCQELLDALARADVWLADGTFSVAPNLFFQLYSIHFQFGNGFNPAALYCLLPNKTGETYYRMISALKSLLPTANPSKIIVDFEKAAMVAFERGFPGATITGCYFHLCQSVIRKVNEIGMKQDYQNNMELRTFIRCLAALAFVPTADVLEAYNSLVATAVPHEHIDSLLKFFKHTYIRGKLIELNMSFTSHLVITIR